MIPVKSNFPPGKIGVVTTDQARFNEFTQCLLKLYVPYGTTWQWVQGNGFAFNRNLIIDSMTRDDKWAWFIDDDHEFAHDILMQLLQRDKDIIQPLCSTRKPPYRPYAYTYDSNTNGFITPEWNQIPIRGLSKWDAVGTGGMLISRQVLDAVKYPWFEEGKLGSEDSIGEDLYFCKKAQNLGFECFVDSDHRLGHLSKHTVWPNPNPVSGEWIIDFDMRHGVAVRVPTDIGKDQIQETNIKQEKLRIKT